MKEDTIKAKIMKESLNLAKEVKSNYILKHIFSFLYENKILYMIKYNKIFQNKLDVDIKSGETTGVVEFETLLASI